MILATFAALLAFLVLAYAVHVAHDVARRWLADRAEARTHQVAADAKKVAALEERIAGVEKQAAEQRAAIAGLINRGARR